MADTQADAPESNGPLLGLPPSGVPPVSRFRDAKSANEWAEDKYEADRWASYDRAVIDDLIDGSPPMDPESLRESGMGTCFNINFQRAFAQEEQALAAYHDLANSDELLINCEVDYKGSAQEKDHWARIYAEGFTRLYRYFWPNFIPNLQLLSKYFIRHGVGIAFRGNEYDWRWDVSRLGDFQISRREGCAVDDLECAVQYRQETPTDVFAMIRDEEVARRVGWDIAATKKAIQKAAVIVSGADNGNGWDWEQVQRDAKDNGLYLTKGKDPRVELRHFWVKEFDGKVSHIITSPTNDENFLFKHKNRWNSVGDCIVFFTYGIGNGDFYSIRGLGYKIFAMEQMFNVLVSRLGDYTLRSMSTLWQPQNAEAAMDANQIIWGSDTIVPQGLNPVQQYFQNVGQNALPFINLLNNIEAMNTGTYSQSMQLLAGGRPDRESATRAAIDAQKEAILTSSAKLLFMLSLDRTYSMSSRALTRRDYPREMPGGPERWMLLRYCMERGMPEEAFYNIQCVRATRPIGMGSPVEQEQKLQAMMAILPMLDTVAKRMLLRKYANAKLGLDYGELLVPSEPRIPLDKKTAELEANSFINGIIPEILPEEDDLVHLQEHVSFCAETLAALEQQQIDPQSALARLIPAIEHSSMHAERLAQNPTKQRESNDVNQMLQRLQSRIQQIGQNLAQEQQAAMEAAQREQQALSAEALKQQRENLKLQSEIERKQMETEAQIEMDRVQVEADVRSKAAKTAAEVASKIDLTQADISSKGAKTKADIVAKDVTTASKLRNEQSKARKRRSS